MTCVKKKVTCFIVSADSEYIFVGTNDVKKPQSECPRKPGEGYEKCKSICHQEGHAEEMAILEAEKAGVSLKGATAYLWGIGHYCKDCQTKLFAAGVKSLQLVETENVYLKFLYPEE